MTFSNLQASGPETFPQLRTRVSSCLERAGVSEFDAVDGSSALVLGRRWVGRPAGV